MPDADVIKSPTHTSLWTDGDTAAAVYVWPAVVVSLLINHHGRRARRRAAVHGTVSDWPTDGVVGHVQGCGQMRERGKERQQGN